MIRIYYYYFRKNHKLRAFTTQVSSELGVIKLNLLNVPRYKSLLPATLPILACHLPCW